MHLRATAILCAARPEGETGVIARLLTADHGLLAAYVAGGRGRRLRPVLIPGNDIAAEITPGLTGRLAFARIELTRSRAPFLAEPLPAAAIVWITALTAATLPEGHPYPALHLALGGLLDAICHAPSARGWAPALLLYEMLMLTELGYGGAPLPRAPPPDGDAFLLAFDRLGRGIERYLLAHRAGDVMASRAVLRDRLARIWGISPKSEDRFLAISDAVSKTLE